MMRDKFDPIFHRMGPNWWPRGWALYLFLIALWALGIFISFF